MKGFRFILIALLVLLMFAVSGCTTYSLYIDEETGRQMTFYPVETADNRAHLYFGNWSAELRKGFGLGVEFSQQIGVSGKSRAFSYIQYYRNEEVADVSGTYEYGKAGGSFFGGFLRVEATLSNKLSGTAIFREGQECRFELSLKEERRDGETVGSVSRGGRQYRITARTAVISAEGSMRYRDEAQGFTIWDGNREIALVSLRRGSRYVAVRSDLSINEKHTAATAAALLIYRSQLEF